MNKYQNIVFDMGNVLLDFSPFTITSFFTQDTHLIQHLVEEIFLKQEWLDLDQGIINEDEAYQAIKARVNVQYHALILAILTDWHMYLFERVEMIELLNLLKLKGYKLYLFSNASSRFHVYKGNFKCLTYFDKHIISADLKHAKPSACFYHNASHLCGIQLNESFFIDDSQLNITQAMHYGMDGYIHNGTIKLLYDYLKKVEIL